MNKVVIVYGVEDKLLTVFFHISENLKWHYINIIAHREKSLWRAAGTMVEINAQVALVGIRFPGAPCCYLWDAQQIVE